MIRYDEKFEKPGPSRKHHGLDALRALTNLDLASATPLTGGFSHQTFEVTRSDRTGREILRVGGEGAATERAVIDSASAWIDVPKIIAGGSTWTLMTRARGIRADIALRRADATDAARIIEACAEAMAKIHRRQHERAGFFGVRDGSLCVEHRLDGAGTGLLDYMLEALEHPRCRARLGERRARDLELLLEKNRPIFTSLDEHVCLTHADMNTKNILVERGDERWHVTAVLDWEFAFAGSSLCDIGNFLRFEHELELDTSSAFARGYENIRPLPRNWRATASLVDLCSMFSFLERDSLSARTERTAVTIIDRTLSHPIHRTPRPTSHHKHDTHQ